LDGAGLQSFAGFLVSPIVGLLGGFGALGGCGFGLCGFGLCGFGLHRLHNRSLCNPHGLGDLLGLGDLGD